MGFPFFWRKESETAIDPICNMEVQKSNPPGGTARHEGQSYYFCGASCRHEFESDPARHAAK